VVRAPRGATTILDVGTMPGGPEAFTKLVGEMGVRAYLGPAFRSAEYVFDGDRVVWEWNEAQGKAGLERAIAYARQYDGAYNGRIRAMIYPGQMDTCTPDLLRDARRAADELNVPVQFHAAMNQREFHKILEQHGKTRSSSCTPSAFSKSARGLGTACSTTSTRGATIRTATICRSSPIPASRWYTRRTSTRRWASRSNRSRGIARAASTSPSARIRTPGHRARDALGGHGVPARRRELHGGQAARRL
jgi:hypothetical protein